MSPPILRRSDVAADIGCAAGVEFRAYYETGRSLFCGPGSLTISRHIGTNPNRDERKGALSPVEQTAASGHNYKRVVSLTKTNGRSAPPLTNHYETQATSTA